MAGKRWNTQVNLQWNMSIRPHKELSSKFGVGRISGPFWRLIVDFRISVAGCAFPAEKTLSSTTTLANPAVQATPPTRTKRTATNWKLWSSSGWVLGPWSRSSSPLLASSALYSPPACSSATTAPQWLWPLGENCAMSSWAGFFAATPCPLLS